jgi:hypothetical protein
MDPRRIPKEDAESILQVAACKLWAEAAAHAWQENSPEAVARAADCLRAALSGIERWTDAVYESGVDPDAADEEFLLDPDRKLGMGSLRPSEVIDRALESGWVLEVKNEGAGGF